MWYFYVLYIKMKIYELEKNEELVVQMKSPSDLWKSFYDFSRGKFVLSVRFEDKNYK